MLQQLFGTGAYLASPSPILTPNEAHLVALSLTSAYVGGLYVSRLALLHNHRLRSNKHVTSSSSSSSRSDINGKQDTPLEDLVESDSTADLDRDDPRVIKSRIRAVGIATLGGCATVGGLVYCRANHQDLGSAFRETLRYLGFPSYIPTLTLSSLSSLASTSPSAAITAIKNFPIKPFLKAILPYTLAPILFLGPIFTGFLEKTWPGQVYGKKLCITDGGVFDCFNLLIPDWLQRLGSRLLGTQAYQVPASPAAEQRAKMIEKQRWVEMRNYVAGPVTEELVFRSAVISTYVLAGFGVLDRWKVLTFGTPLWFGLAHAHHAWEVYKKGGRTTESLIRAVVSAGFQFTYTTLFGSYAAYLFIRTGSIFPSITSHVFCNVMGLPNPVEAIHQWPQHKLAIITSYLLGMVGFVWGLKQL